MVTERILPEILDNVTDWTGEIIRKMTTLGALDKQAAELSYDIIRDGLLREVCRQVNDVMLTEADARITKLFEKK